ncbi:MAG TPA: lysophospholipid acyltransferase family protein [Pirellulales bacterium]|jgi:1-acyl-sn-glycerol-3-phosphate acyltransferase|nr:lysophospholipid acyltransferase family protein [Pirellulales bacterium]
MVQRSFPKRLWYDVLRVVCRMAGILVFRIRCRGRNFVPPTGGGLVLSNHQSHLDPVLVGLATDRRLNYLARDTLFKFAPFRWLIRSLDAIPLDREGLGLAGLKETLKRLKRGELVLIFPEGTRTRDGEVGVLKPGFCALARRAGVPLLPVGIDGAFDSWPRWKSLPGRAVIHIQFGEPLEPAEIAKLDDRQLVAEMDRRIRAAHAAARTYRQCALEGTKMLLEVGCHGRPSR